MSDFDGYRVDFLLPKKFKPRLSCQRQQSQLESCSTRMLQSQVTSLSEFAHLHQVRRRRQSCPYSLFAQMLTGSLQAQSLAARSFP